MPDPKNPSTQPAADSVTPNGTLDTGTGGFPIGPKNDMHQYDVGVFDESGVKGTWTQGNIKTYTEPQDLSTGTKRTLASYLSKVTMASPDVPLVAKVKNVYTVDGEYVSDTKITTVDGYPRPPEPTGNSSKFVDVNTNTIETLRTVSNAYTAAFKEEKNFVKGRNQLRDADPVKVADGNTLLANITLKENSIPNPSANVKTGMIDPDINPALTKYSGAITKNRFTSDGAYGNVGTRSLQFHRNYTMGESSITSKREPDLSFGQLTQVGVLLGARATRELGAFDDKATPDEAAALLPGTTQIGIERIENILLEARDVLDSLDTKNPDAGDIEDVLITPTKLSWGSLNNTFDRFAGVTNFGMQLLSVALLVAIGLVVGAFAAFIPFSPPSLSLGGDPIPVTEIYALGSYRNRGRDIDFSIGGIIDAITSGNVNWLSLLGLKTTINDYFECVFFGALAFFGIGADPTEGVGSGEAFGRIVADAAVKGLQNPGFNITMSRAINRSFLTIIDAFAAFAKVSNPVSGIKQVFEVISTIRDSKFIGAINVFSSLGDAIINDVKEYNVTPPDKKGFGQKVSAIDALEPNDGPGDHAHKKSRLGLNGTKLNLAWSTYRAIDQILLSPQTVKSIALGQQLNSPAIMNSEVDHLRSAGGAKINPYRVRDDGRIPTEERENIERFLDSEYVPFYFHDVRTNEIISFHAFLASLSDDYAASYDSAEAFGRVEPIKVYKNTIRKIGFSFYIAALSPNDFDSMWIKINKLTTLVYPQFTKGKYVNTPDNKYLFTAPFSQMMSASPMVRVRIGDLIRSNYSKYNLARLFGYGDGSTIFDEKPGTDFAKSGPEVVEALQNAMKEIEKAKSTPGDGTFTVTSNLPEPDAGSGSPDTKIPAGIMLGDGLVLEIKSVTGDNATCVVKLADESSGDFSKTEIDNAKMLYDNADRPATKIVGLEYTLPKSALRPTSSTLQKKLGDGIGKNTTDYQTAIEQFMNDDPYDAGSPSRGNAVSRSFRSAGGKGLAGFIESMAFDWMDKVTWETKQTDGYRAPKMCKVTVSFSPIHDIAPGLDHQGVNRAPIYPVGPFVPRR